MAECSTQPSGSGTEQDPYIITDVCELNWIRNALSAYYELGNDIDASDTGNWDSGQGWTPIVGFSGSVDGKDYSINSLYVDRSITGATSSWGVGLFRNLSAGAAISNLSILKAHIEGSYSGTGHSAHMSGGILAAWVDSNSGNHTEIEYVFTSGIVKVDSTVPYPGSGNQPQVHAGGVVGHMTTYGYLRKCASTANVTTSSYESSWAYAGGLVGRMYDGGALYNSYARGSATAIGTDLWEEEGIYTYAWAGGLVGEVRSVDNCYSTGVPSASGARLNYIGGFSGRSGNGTINDSFWDTETSGYATGCGEGTPSGNGPTGKTTAQMKTQSTFTDAGWDFTTVWNIDADYNNGYPILRDLPFQPSLFAGYIWIEGTKFAYTDSSRTKRTQEGTKSGATGQTAGHLWVEGNDLRYIDSSGDERYITGTQDGATGQTAGHMWIEDTKFRYIDSSGNERYIEGST